MQLTDEQHAIITQGFEHCVITAVAGSGKTTTLAWRIRYLLEQGHDPERMLILMFNRSARDDFTRKLREITHQDRLPLPEIRTYHAMGFRLYQRFIREGFLPGYQGDVLGDQEIQFQVWHLLRQLVPEDLQDEARRNKKEFVETATGFIDRVKTTLTPVENVFEALDYGERHRYLIDLFHAFEQWRKRERRISYADMLYEPVMAIHQNPPLQKLVANKMDMILVDEYQDTNEIQHLLLRYIAGDRARVTVVGDPDQTIYEFRGARPEFILNRFGEEFETPLEQTLSYTFRYGHRVALLANHLISHNRGRKDVLCHAHASTPDTRIHRHVSDDDADIVVRLARDYLAEGRPLQQIAILFRVWSQSVAIELRLLAQGIPYRIENRKGALFTREVEAIIHLLQIASGRLETLDGPARHRAALHLLRFPHVGLRERELYELAEYISQFDRDWGKILLNLDTQQWKPLPARKVRKLGRALEELQGFPGRAGELIRCYAETTELNEGLRSLALTHETADERIGTVAGFRHYLDSLDVDAAGALAHLERLQAEASQTRSDGLHLSTMHRSKGLEWPVVVIPGLQEKYLPYTLRQTDNLAAFIESERRLLYVAMTRSREALHLLTRPTRAIPDDAEQSPSRFMSELCFDLCDELGQGLGDEAPTLTLNSVVSATARRYAQHYDRTLIGTEPTTEADAEDQLLWHRRKLHHAVFGPGDVVGEDERAFEVRFHSGETMNFSKKSAHLYFSPLESAE